MQIRGLGSLTDPARHLSPAGPRHREIPLHFGARTRRAVLGECTIGVGRNSRDDGKEAEHPPRCLLAFGRDARLRRGRREVRKLPISGPESPGSATCSWESYLPRENYVIRGNASQRATGPVPAAAHRGTSGHRLPAASLLRAPRGYSRPLGRA